DRRSDPPNTGASERPPSSAPEDSPKQDNDLGPNSGNECRRCADDGGPIADDELAGNGRSAVDSSVAPAASASAAPSSAAAAPSSAHREHAAALSADKSVADNDLTASADVADDSGGDLCKGADSAPPPPYVLITDTVGLTSVQMALDETVLVGLDIE